MECWEFTIGIMEEWVYPPGVSLRWAGDLVLYQYAEIEAICEWCDRNHLAYTIRTKDVAVTHTFVFDDPDDAAAFKFQWMHPPRVE